MRRRDLLTGLGAGAVATGLAGCSETDCGDGATQQSHQSFNWKMVTTWPPKFPMLGTGALYLADIIEQMSGGRLKIKVYAAGELVPAFEVFDAVSDGTAEIGHAASYYWKGKSQAAQLFSAVPFGMNAQEMNAWIMHGDGLELWQEVYAPFNIIPAPVGNSGVQMGGWFNREINSVDDLRGLKMRIPGLGAEVLRRAGGTPVSMPGSEIFTSLQTGAIDATEFVGPANDLAFGFHQVAKYYYYPGWHEPTALLEGLINRDAFNALPRDLQVIVLRACDAASQNMLADYTASNQRALSTLVNEHGVELRPFPADVLDRLRTLTDEILDETAADDPLFARVLDNYREFKRDVSAWHDVSENVVYQRLRG
ncbi:MAG: TRAP transporter substrate-binding protein [Gammaproteobacteria bacterium]|nr:TRAP transporter substrate-binding protein [Gammaproteobacteria bacterium]